MSDKSLYPETELTVGDVRNGLAKWRGQLENDIENTPSTPATTNHTKVNYNAEYVAACAFKAIETVLLVDKAMLTGKCQKQDTVFGRQIFYLVMHYYSYATLTSIAKLIGKHRTTAERQLELAKADLLPRSNLFNTYTQVQQFLQTINLHPVK